MWARQFPVSGQIARGRPENCWRRGRRAGHTADDRQRPGGSQRLPEAPTDAPRAIRAATRRAQGCIFPTRPATERCPAIFLDRRAVARWRLPDRRASRRFFSKPDQFGRSPAVNARRACFRRWTSIARSVLGSSRARILLSISGRNSCSVQAASRAIACGCREITLRLSLSSGRTQSTNLSLSRTVCHPQDGVC